MRRNLGRLIVLGELCSNSIYTNYSTTTTTSRRAFPTIFNLFNSLHFSGGYTECKHYHSEAETVGGSDHTFVRSITNYSRRALPTIFNLFNSLHFSGGYTECKHYHAEAETIGGSNRTFVQSISKGDTICLNGLLFTNNRDYLVRNKGQHVKPEQLEGKVIGIYFVPLSAKDPRHSAWYTALLKDIYDDLHPVNNFEIVLVACNDLDPDFREENPIHRSPQSDS